MKGNFSVGTKDGDITTYTRKYNVVLATDKDGFVDAKEYDTNRTTMVTYGYPKASNPAEITKYTVNFPIPVVKGYKHVATGTSKPKEDPKTDDSNNDDPKPEVTPETKPEPTPLPNPDPENPRPAYPRNNIPDANDPNSPDEITIIDDNGVPLGNYEKKRQPDGNMEYVIVDEDIPLGGLLPTTGGYGVKILLVFGGFLVLAGIFLRKKEKE